MVGVCENVTSVQVLLRRELGEAFGPTRLGATRRETFLWSATLG
jgi:hypothetical protein